MKNFREKEVWEQPPLKKRDLAGQPRGVECKADRREDWEDGQTTMP